MNAIIHNFQNELSQGEREVFAANARLAGRRPGAHLKAIIFGEAQGAERGSHGAGRMEHGAEDKAHSATARAQAKASPSAISGVQRHHP